MDLLGSSQPTAQCPFGGQLGEHHGTTVPGSLLSHLHMEKLRHVGSLSHPIPPYLTPSHPVPSHPTISMWPFKLPSQAGKARLADPQGWGKKGSWGWDFH